MKAQPVTRETFRARFRLSSRAFHLELRDTYGVDQENQPYRRWLNGEPDDYSWRAPWLTFVREVTSDGVSVQRARVVTEPRSDYVCWEMALDPQNIEAGEDVRYLPRHLAAGIDFPSEDCWLFDNNALILSLFHPDGSSGGFAASGDTGLLGQYIDVRDQVWSRAIPSANYVT